MAAALVWGSAVWIFPARRAPCAAEPAAGRYTAEVVGVEEEALLERIRQLTDTFALAESPPGTLPLLRKRAEDDIPVIERLLRAEGYFDASAEAGVTGAPAPYRVRFKVSPGDVYVIDSVRIGWADGAEPSGRALPSASDIGLAAGAPARSRLILDAAERLESHFENLGHPFAEVTGRRLELDGEAHTATVLLEIDPGSEAVFGTTSISGLDRVEEPYVLNRLDWDAGDPFDRGKLDGAQMELLRTGLFSLARVEPATGVADGGGLPVYIELTERKHRTVSAGANYKTDYGPGGKLAWEHRNLFGRGETLSMEGIASGLESSANILYSKPDFLRTDQFFIANLRAGYDDPDPYLSRNIGATLEVERIVDEHLILRGGLSYRLANVTQLGDTEDFGLLSIPLQARWDYSDDLLNPTEGWRLLLESEPFYDTFGTNTAFWRNHLKARHYIPLLDAPGLVLAGQVGLGSLTGASRDALPADERFYAGGGGSVRGYAHQTVSPLVNNHPVGGRSILDLSVELRWMAAKNIGLAAFVDGGNAFESEYPDFRESLLWGAGVGFRYHTPIGPFRIDAAFPLNRREIDDPFQIYISIGQAF